MELSRADQESIEETLALAAKWIATMRAHVAPFAGPAVLQSGDATLSDIVACLIVLDPAREQADFEATIAELFERRKRKNSIQRLAI